MIYYFSGTGNSRAVAERLAESTHDYAQSITHCDSYISEISQPLGFVFPIYAWSVPDIMVRFIERALFQYTPPYVYMVCTCGDDIGLTLETFKIILKKKGIRLDAAWSVTMPNTYICLPGFDIDNKETTQNKLRIASWRINQISTQIITRRRHIEDVTPGAFPWLKSKILGPLFNLFLTGDRAFKVNHKCVHCGLCAAACPVENISYNNDGKPTWNANCTNCMACYHICPQHAISFGPFTKRKGQYILHKNTNALKGRN